MFGPSNKEFPDMPEEHMVKIILAEFNKFGMTDIATCLGVLEIVKHNMLMQSFEDLDDYMKDDPQ